MSKYLVLSDSTDDESGWYSEEASDLQSARKLAKERILEHYECLECDAERFVSGQWTLTKFEVLIVQVVQEYDTVPMNAAWLEQQKERIRQEKIAAAKKVLSDLGEPT